MTALLVATAEPSKVPFYVTGALLVVWAVALAGVGLTSPSFPYGKLGQRVTMAVSLLLAAGVVASAIATSK